MGDKNRGKTRDCWGNVLSRSLVLFFWLSIPEAVDKVDDLRNRGFSDYEYENGRRQGTQFYVKRWMIAGRRVD